MFDRILFYYDTKGEFRGKVNNDGAVVDEPLELKASDCNARYFTFHTTTVRGHRSSVPGIQVVRRLEPLSKDPYNEDGSPSTVMFQMACALVEYGGESVVVEGFEQPNLCWAGLLILPYTREYKLKKGVNYLTEEQNDRRKFTPYVKLHRQRVEFLMSKSLMK